MRPRHVALGAAAAALWLTAAGMAALRWRPFQTITALRRVRLAAAGVRRVRVGPLAGYERDGCRAGEACRCVALLHGLGDSALTWDKVLLGRGGAAAPPSGTRLLALEYPGSEGSFPPASPSGYAVSAMAETVRASLSSRCPEWTIAGNSLGGWIAAWIALRWPDGVRRLVLVDAAGLDDPSGDLVKVARALEDPSPELMKDFLARAYYRHPPLPPAAWPAVLEAIRARPTAKIVAALRKEDLVDARARDIRAPTVVLWGEADRVTPLAMGRAYASKIPGARLAVAPRCGHLPQQECPSAVTDALYP